MPIENQPIASEIGRKMKEIRELRRLTQAELGARAGMVAASVSHFETGQRTPTVDSLVKIASALDVPVDVVLGRMPLEESTQLDPIFRQASRASASTLDAIRKVTAALLAGMEPKKKA